MLLLRQVPRLCQELAQGLLIMMAVEGSTITSRLKNLLRSPSIKLRRSKAGSRRADLSSKVSLGLGAPFPQPSPPLLHGPPSPELLLGKEEN